MNRLTDITVGDFPGAKESLGTFYDNKGISFIMINSDKGLAIYELAKKNFETVSVNMKTYTQPNLQPIEIEGGKNQEFWDVFRDKGFEYLLKCYTEEGWKLHLWGSFKRILRGVAEKIKGLHYE